MNTVQHLQDEAINAAQHNDWLGGVERNNEILGLEPENISALNRLGFCLLQLGKTADAEKIYKDVLRVDKYNTIAKKYLALLGNGQQIAVGQTAFHESFIEEPGKTRSIQLCRVADPKALLSVAVGTPCTLKPKTHRIAVETATGTYLGSLPDDLSHHLTKLITAGNKYQIVVQSVNKVCCTIFIKELSRSKRYQYTSSFPIAQNKNSATDVREELMVDQAPLDLSETGQEEDNDVTTLIDEEPEEMDRR